MADDEKQKKPRRRRTKKDAEAEATEATATKTETTATETEATEEEAAKKPRRRRARKQDDAESGEATAEAKAEDAPEAESAPDAEDAGDEAAEEKHKRRGSAETSTPQQAQSKPEPRRDAQGAVIVQARARYVRSAPRKARLVMDHIRGKPVQDAVAMLTHTPRSASRDVLKLLNSAIANAENNYELGADELRVHRATVDEGPTIKRYQPRALGRATRIDKRTSHMTIMLTTATEPASSAKRKRRR
jgi:ribosomal protein L22